MQRSIATLIRESQHIGEVFSSTWWSLYVEMIIISSQNWAIILCLYVQYKKYVLWPSRLDEREETRRAPCLLLLLWCILTRTENSQNLFFLFLQFAMDVANIWSQKCDPSVLLLCNLGDVLTLIWSREEFGSVRCHAVFKRKKKSSNNERTILVYVLSNFLLHLCKLCTCFFDCSYTNHAGLCG